MPEILSLLKKHAPIFVSGEDACRELGISRQAVWKQVQVLRKLGYGVESKPHDGYRLVLVPDRLYPAEVECGLNSALLGHKMVYYESVGSTNDVARELARGGAPEGTLVVAEEQTCGKGRRGRLWSCPAGQGLLFSLVLRPQVSPGLAPQLTMLAAVAMSRAVESSAGLSTGIKWPNDLLIGGKKVCGILTEMDAEPEMINHVVIGVGLNVNTGPGDLPGELKDKATSLMIQAGKRIDRVSLLQQCLREIEEYYHLWQSEGFAPIRLQWRELCLNLGHFVRVLGPGFTLEGRAEDIDGDGALLLRLEDGEQKRILAGDLSLVPAE